MSKASRELETLRSRFMALHAFLGALQALKSLDAPSQDIMCTVVRSCSMLMAFQFGTDLAAEINQRLVLHAMKATSNEDCKRVTASCFKIVVRMQAYINRHVAEIDRELGRAS